MVVSWTAAGAERGVARHKGLSRWNAGLSLLVKRSAAVAAHIGSSGRRSPDAADARLAVRPPLPGTTNWVGCSLRLSRRWTSRSRALMFMTEQGLQGPGFDLLMPKARCRFDELSDHFVRDHACWSGIGLGRAVVTT